MQLSENNKQDLLKIARLSILSLFYPDSKNLEFFDKKPIEMETGAFVTLHKNSQLRGCIGMMTSNLPLHKTIEKMAKQAAFHDPRFSPLREDELPNIVIEISVLSPFEKISYEDIEIGKHGLLLKYAYRSGVFLPQVPVEQKWSKEEYIRNLYQKAGIPFTETTQRDAELFAFMATVFSE